MAAPLTILLEKLNLRAAKSVGEVATDVTTGRWIDRNAMDILINEHNLTNEQVARLAALRGFSKEEADEFIWHNRRAHQKGLVMLVVNI